MEQWPAVSVIMPVRNEEPYLADAVRHVLDQDYPGDLEVVLAVGPSRDRTLQIAYELASGEPRLTVVSNPSGEIPAGLNLALDAARYDILARMDGHAMMSPGYLRQGVVALYATGAADVGGIMAAEGLTPFQRAVAWGMTSKAGVGAASWHTAGGAGPADSAYLGIYRRDAVKQAGGWDESMLRAEDWELNYRIRANGGLIWFTPDLRVTYRPRRTVRTLASQYWHYGRWRRVVMRDHPETASFRYLAPPGALTVSLLGLVAGIAGLAAGLPWLALGFVVPAGYLAGVTVVGFALSGGVPSQVRLRVPAVLVIMHMSWGAGFVTSPRGLRRVTASKLRYENMGLWNLIFGVCSPSGVARGTSCGAST